MGIDTFLSLFKLVRTSSQRLSQPQLQLLISTNSTIRPKMSTSLSVLEQVLAKFSRPEIVKIGNRSKTEKLVNSLVNDGLKSLQVITDFDATLTSYQHNGKKCDSCYGIIANNPLISPDYHKKAMDIYKKYYPIEIDPKISVEQKTPYMIEWYEQSHTSLIASSPRMNKSLIKDMIKTSYVYLREDATEMMKILSKADVPVLVLSAGIGDLVEEFLKQNGIDFPNVKVISNFMQFDKNGDVVGFKDPLIHMYNKNEAALHDMNSKYFDDLKPRTNVILMGDSLGDTNMDRGVSNPEAVLRIGFLNSHFEEHLEAYMAVYDIVLVDDQSMDLVNLILSHIITTDNSN